MSIASGFILCGWPILERFGRHLRITAIVTALWLAWAIITPIDWIRDHLRKPAHLTQRKGREVGGVGDRVHRESL